MHHRVLLAGLAGLAYGSPVAQLIPLDQIATFAPLPSVSVPMGDGASSQSVSYDATKVISSTFASVAAHPASGSVARRDACAQQPLGSGPSPSTDTDKDFLEYSALSDIAIKASTPSGYTRTFKNLTASNNAMAYMGYMSLDSYDTQQCADECTKKDGCISFNICKASLLAYALLNLTYHLSQTSSVTQASTRPLHAPTPPAPPSSNASGGAARSTRRPQ